MPRKWTEEERIAQAERCRQTQPWKHSTGPRTARGKRKVSRNACKDAYLALWNELYTQGLHHEARLIYRRLMRRVEARARHL